MDAGKHHALLTAHLSPKGNELDLFFESSDSKSPTPVALAFPSLKGFASRKGEVGPHELIFEPAPEGERPSGEKQGTCSHFVAKAPWIKATDELSVAVPMEFDGGGGMNEAGTLNYDSSFPRQPPATITALRLEQDEIFAM